MLGSLHQLISGGLCHSPPPTVATSLSSGELKYSLSKDGLKQGSKRVLSLVLRWFPYPFIGLELSPQFILSFFLLQSTCIYNYLKSLFKELNLGRLVRVNHINRSGGRLVRMGFFLDKLCNLKEPFFQIY